MYDEAVVRLQCGSTSSGTGYLVDAERGYVVTAHHVVKLCTGLIGQTVQAATAPLPLTVRSEATGSKDLPAKVRRTLSPSIDIALVQVNNPEALREVVPLDIALDVPAKGATLHILGYPNGSYAQHPQRVQYIALTGDTLQVSHWSAEGYSGAPLITEHGLVVATCVTRTDNAVSQYVPTARWAQLFSDLPQSTRLSAIDAMLRECRFESSDDFAQRLERRRGRLSNVEMVEWSFRMARDPDEYSGCKEYFGIPLEPAFRCRQLIDSVTFLRPLFARAVIARAYMRTGIRDQDLSQLAVAADQLRLAMNDRVTEDGGGLAAAFCTLGIADTRVYKFGARRQLTFDAAAIASQLGGSFCRNGRSDSPLSVNFKEYGELCLETARLSSEAAKELWTQEAAAAAVMATLVTQNTSHQASALALLGEAFRASKEYGKASDAYAAAFRKGAKFGWIKSNWKSATESAGRPVPAEIPTNSPFLNPNAVIGALPVLVLSPEDPQP